MAVGTAPIKDQCGKPQGDHLIIGLSLDPAAAANTVDRGPSADSPEVSAAHKHICLWCKFSRWQ